MNVSGTSCNLLYGAGNGTSGNTYTLAKNDPQGVTGRMLWIVLVLKKTL